MSNDLQAFFGELDMSKAAAAYGAVEIPNAPTVIDGLILRFTKGKWVYGQQNQVPADNSTFIVNPMSLSIGYIAWKDKKPTERMAKIGEPPITADSLPSDMGLNSIGPNANQPVTWQPQVAITLMGLSGPEKGKTFVYKTSSKGGCGAVAALKDAVALQASQLPTHFFPVVKLGVDGYDNATYATYVYTPVFDIQHFVDPEGNQFVEPEQLADENAKPRRKKAA